MKRYRIWVPSKEGYIISGFAKLTTGELRRRGLRIGDPIPVEIAPSCQRYAPPTGELLELYYDESIDKTTEAVVQEV